LRAYAKTAREAEYVGLSSELFAVVSQIEEKEVEELSVFDDIDTVEAFDDLVHDCLSRDASNINNGGVFEQIEFLMKQGHSLEELKKLAGIE